MIEKALSLLQHYAERKKKKPQNCTKYKIKIKHNTNNSSQIQQKPKKKMEKLKIQPETLAANRDTKTDCTEPGSSWLRSL